MDKVKELLLAYFGRTLNLTADEVTALLFANAEGTEVKADALTGLLSKDTERVQKFKDERQTFFENGYKKAQKESLSDLEKQIREKFELNSDKQGVELVQELIDEKLKAVSTIDDEKVKISPLYVKTVNEYNKKVKDTETIWETKFKEREQGIQKEKAFQVVQSKAKGIIDTLKPILPKDQAKAQRQLEWFFKELTGYDFQIQDDTILIQKDGKLLEDGHGNRVTFDEFVKSSAGNYWEFESGTQKKGAGNEGGQTNGQQGAAGGQTVKAPKDKAEYVKMISAAETPELRIAIDDAWKASQEVTE